MYPRIIWIYWAQGWDQAPEICKKVRKSWEIYNPTWEIRAISNREVYGLLDMTGFPNDRVIQIQSDWIRLSLLSTYGGVWVDSTLLCMKPLDLWLPQDAPFFMFRGNLLGTSGPDNSCTWLIASRKNCYSIRKWKDALTKRWENDNTPRWMCTPIFFWNYFSIDMEWNKLRREDEMCKREWENVPYMSSDDPDILLFKYTGYSSEIERKLSIDPPPVVKLAWRVKSDDPETNINVALRLALNGQQF
jgi:hypothetical protein